MGGKMHSGPIDIDKYEYATGAQIRMKMILRKERRPREKHVHRETEKLANNKDNWRPRQNGPDISRHSQRDSTGSTIRNGKGR